MSKNIVRYRNRIHITLDVTLLSELVYLSEHLDLPKGRILEITIENILRKGMLTNKKINLLGSVNRNTLNTTINSKLWESFRCYANSNGNHLNYLIEMELPKTIRQLKRKLNNEFL